MIEIIQTLQAIIERGLIFGVLVAGVYLASRLIKYDNLAVEGAFGLGGALTALLISNGYNPWLSLLAAAIFGAFSGVVTGLLTTHLKLNNLLSGIVVTTGAFSIILKLAGSNLPLGVYATIFTPWTSSLEPYMPLIVLLILCAGLFMSISWLLTTEIGFLLIAVGDTPQMLLNVGKSPQLYTIFGLSLSNLLAAVAGSLFVQYAGYFSIWAGVGVLVVSLAGMILGQLISKHFGAALLLGSILYQAVIALTFELQLDQDWNKLITACIIVVLIFIKNHINEQ